MGGRYEAALRANNAMDFDDILPLAVAILRHCPSVLEYYQARWKHVLVDEFQDTNSGQYEFVRSRSNASCAPRLSPTHCCCPPAAHNRRSCECLTMTS